MSHHGLVYNLGTFNLQTSLAAVPQTVIARVIYTKYFVTEITGREISKFLSTEINTETLIRVVPNI